MADETSRGGAAPRKTAIGMAIGAGAAEPLAHEQGAASGSRSGVTTGSSEMVWPRADLPQTLPRQLRAHVEAVADRLDRELGLREAALPWQPWRLSDGEPGCSLHLEDVSRIPFVAGIPGVEEYQHRARVRASDGDLFAATTAPIEGYEDYCRGLGLGAPTLLPLRPVDSPLAVARACRAPEALEILAAHARRAGRLTLHPYMGIEDVWALAPELARASGGADVRVLAPPPPALWLANDKELLVRTVEATLGDAWNVRTARARSAAALGSLLGEFASDGARRVGLKRTRCASAMGNEVHDATLLRAMGAAQRQALVERFLERTEWCGTEEVLVVVWEDAVRSPSTQLWIPARESGEPPRLDGVYDQLLEGEEQVFLGCRPSRLPAPVQLALAGASLQVAGVFQELGYVGRCSFDFIVMGDPEAEFRALFTECNGRWGGTSTPMHLVDRLHPGGRPDYRAQGFAHEALRGKTMDEVRAAVGPLAWGPDAPQRGGLLFFNPGPLRLKGKLDVIAVGPHADALLEEALPERLARAGLSG